MSDASLEADALEALDALESAAADALALEALSAADGDGAAREFETGGAGAHGGVNRWWYSLEGTQLGPVSARELASMLQQGTLCDASFVYEDGADDWVQMASVHALLASELAFESPCSEWLLGTVRAAAAVRLQAAARRRLVGDYRLMQLPSGPAEAQGAEGEDHPDYMEGDETWRRDVDLGHARTIPTWYSAIDETW